MTDRLLDMLSRCVYTQRSLQDGCLILLPRGRGTLFLCNAPYLLTPVLCNRWDAGGHFSHCFREGRKERGKLIFWLAKQHTSTLPMCMGALSVSVLTIGAYLFVFLQVQISLEGEPKLSFAVDLLPRFLLSVLFSFFLFAFPRSCHLSRSTHTLIFLNRIHTPPISFLPYHDRERSVYLWIRIR